MATESLTMRKTAQELGISQLRVRELIKKGRLEAEKVSDGSGEHWEISRESIDAFREERAENSSDGTPSPTPPPSGAAGGSAGADLATLLPKLEQQLERVKTLVQEVSRAQAYLDQLRTTQRRLEEEVASVRHRVTEEPHRADEGDGRAGPPAPERPETAGKGKRTTGKGETSVGAALRDAGVDDDARKADKGSGKGNEAGS